MWYVLLKIFCIPKSNTKNANIIISVHCLHLQFNSVTGSFNKVIQLPIFLVVLKHPYKLQGQQSFISLI